MAVEDLVELLVIYLRSGEQAFAEHRGGQALAAVEDIRELLREELTEQVKYQALWDDFTANPQNHAAELTGVLEALIEADPGLGEAFDRLMADSRTSVDQGEGAAVRGKARAKAVVRSLPESDAPQESSDAVPREAADDIPQGAYLYGGGDLQSGDISAGDPKEDPATGKAPLVSHGGSVEQKLIFDQLRSTLQEQSGMAEILRSRLEEKLTDLEAELKLGQEAKLEKVGRILQSIQEESPRYFRYVDQGFRQSDYFDLPAVEKIFSKLEKDSE